MDFRYLAIEGPIGLEKTALAERLGARLDATVVLDEVENPFLPDFYSGGAGSAFQAQLFFTLSRHRQQMALRQGDLFSQTTVCNYLFERDRVYAFLNLDDNELLIYQRLFELLARDLPTPNLCDLSSVAGRRPEAPPPRSRAPRRVRCPAAYGGRLADQRGI